ncbi:hypothetical protein NY537_17755 [Curtobacterium flaccumfaciens pv. betae]|uniref:hypothetical protein n=1 Tax=Curtobacterium flaccumfaciens TaxID=2035 RepID=UPI002658A2E1|nr:hypothetical protein [Curtobacterium flaccumfaciens]MCS5514587.1 hypothetical protein [Curtobacterium flaccumfaciens pv. betae]
MLRYPREPACSTSSESYGPVATQTAAQNEGCGFTHGRAEYVVQDDRADLLTRLNGKIEDHVAKVGRSFLKVEKHGQYPNADTYQMATYRRRFGPNEGWLVYVNEGWLVYVPGDVQLGATVVVNGQASHKRAVQLDEALEDVQRALSEIACGVVAGTVALEGRDKSQ